MSPKDSTSDSLRSVAAPDGTDTIGGYPETVAALFRKKDDELKRFLARRLGTSDEAQEVAQEAYARLLALDEPDDPNVLVFRLWRIAANLAKDRLKSRATRNRIDVATLLDPRPAIPSPEPLCIAHERILLIERALRELPPRCGQAFRLRMVEERKYDEVAQVLGVDVRTAKRYVARALAHCQRVINMAESGPHE